MKGRIREKQNMDRRTVPECMGAASKSAEARDVSKIRGIYNMYSAPFKDLFIREAQRLEDARGPRKPTLRRQ